MTTAALTPSINYLENGITRAFVVPFRFQSPQHLAIKRVSPSNVVTALVYGVDYVVTGGETDAGGTATVSVAAVAGTQLKIRRVTPRAQLMDYTTGDTFPAESHELALDTAMLINQEQDVAIEDTQARALLVPEGETVSELPAEADRAGSYLAFDAEGNPVASDGTGADLGLRTDLAATTGSSLIGHNGGPGFSSIQMALNYLKVSVPIHIDARGADGTLAGDSAALMSAFASAETYGNPVVLPARRVFFNEVTIGNPKVRLYGSGMPIENAGRTALEGDGTIVEGKLVFTGAYVTLRDFGVDLGSAGAGGDFDGIKCKTDVYNAGKHLHTENLIALCKTKTGSVAHALLFEGYAKHTGGNLRGVNGRFGCVIKNRNVQLTSISTLQNLETGVYLKSDSTNGQCSDVQIDEIRTQNADEFGLRIQSDSALMENIQIGKMHGSDHQRTVCAQVLDFTNALLRNARVEEILSERSSVADFSILSLRPTSAIYSVGYDSLSAVDPTGRVVEAVCEVGAIIENLWGKKTYASYASVGGVEGDAANIALQAKMDDAAFIGGGVRSSTFERVDVVEANGSGVKIGSFLYSNDADRARNVFGGGRCKTRGTAFPRPGYIEQVLAGAANVLKVRNNNTAQGKGLIRCTMAANSSCTSFAPEFANDELPESFEVTVLNNSSFSLTMINGSNIINASASPAYSNVVIPENSMRTYVRAPGAVWLLK